MIDFLINFVFVLSLGYYLATNLQWYDYKLSRVVLKHHKIHWHFIYFAVPFLLYFALGKYFAYVIPLHLALLYMWHKKLDKKLVFTGRIKRFFTLLIAITLFVNLLCFLKGFCATLSVLLPLFLAYVFSYMVEKYLFLLYKKEAQKKLQSIDGLEIVAITGSYGKTSIKNFLASILATTYKTYATPRSVNTIGGIIKDINESLPLDTKIYICEAGARQRGDIYEISSFLNPQKVVVGKVGLAHIEYFKSLQNIIQTKLEIMQSSRLQKAYIHTSVTDEPRKVVEFFGDDVKNIEATLDGTSFEMELDGEVVKFQSSVLGAFQAINIAVAIRVAKSFGLDNEQLQKAVSELKPVEHRLQLIKAGGKIILDDGYNGNIDGMLEGVRLCGMHTGSKVIVTPGLVESSDELNLKLIEAINGVFDTAIVTGSLNAKLFESNLNVKNVIMLSDKTKLQDALIKHTKAGDIILFANDAPSFI